MYTLAPDFMDTIEFIYTKAVFSHLMYYFFAYTTDLATNLVAKLQVPPP